MDPHNARRPEQIIVADRGRGASYATWYRYTCPSIRGPDCDNHRRGIRPPRVTDLHGRSRKRTGDATQRDSEIAFTS